MKHQRTHQQIAKGLMEKNGKSFSEELGISLQKGTPAELFQWLTASLLFSARIGRNLAMDAAQALRKQGWTTPAKMEKTTWAQRTRVLNRSGYARYDERTSRMLGDTAHLIQQKYGGDLRKLRTQAKKDPAREREFLKEFKGIGDVGVDIFFREAQSVWPELRPFADQKSLRAAKKIGLPQDPKQLARLVPAKDFPKLLAALIRADKK